MSFVRENRRFLLFGLWVGMLSSFGQTYFLGVFRTTISAEFGLSNSSFGFYYLIVTIFSAVGLNRLGHIIDRVPLERYIVGLLLCLAGACLLVGVSGPVISVFGAMMLVRLLGQGMMVHAAMTTMSRYFNRRRGVAVAIAGLGMPIGQALFPPLAVILMTGMAWRTSWLVFGFFCLFAGIPLALWLLKGHRDRHDAWLTAEKDRADSRDSPPGKVWQRKHVIRDWRFYVMLPSLMVVPFWVTMVFFFAADIAAAQQMSFQAFTGFYWLYAAGSACAPFLGGALVDRYGGTRLLAVYPPIMALALGCIMIGGSATLLAAFMALMGLCAGVAIPINNATWAELYGTRHLGEIKSLATSLLVLSTALAPFLVGLALDGGMQLNGLFLVGIFHAALSVPLVWPVSRSWRRR